jgi:hypothetical protein
MPQSGADPNATYIQGIAIGSGMTVLPTSGISNWPEAPNAYITYQTPVFPDYMGANQSVDRVPEFLYYGGNVVYAQNQKTGELITGNADKPFGAG